MKITNQRTQLFWVAIGVYGLIIIISVTYGFQYKYTGESLAMYFRLMTAPFFIVLILLTIGFLGQWGRERTIPMANYIGLCMMSLSFLMTCYFYSYKLPNISWIVIALPVIIVALFLQLKWGSRGSTLGILLFGIILYILFVIHTPHTDGANMLELIEVVVGDFFSGSNPYDKDYQPITAYKLGYLPALWLPYSLPYNMEIDVRIINIICLLIIILLFERTLIKTPAKSDILSVTIYPIVLSPPVAQMITHGHVLPYWLFLFVTAVALYNGRLLFASVMFGLSLAARQPTVFLVPLFAMFIFNKVPLGAFIKYTLTSILTYMVVVLPFAIWTGSEFWMQTYLNINNEVVEGFLVYQISGSGILYALGLENILNYIQVLILMTGVIVIIINKHRNVAWFLYFSAIIFIWDVFFNIYVARYIYIPAIMLLSLSTAISMTDEKSMTVLRN